MILNHLKLGCKVSFMKYVASVISLIFRPETLIWNKMVFPAHQIFKNFQGWC